MIRPVADRDHEAQYRGFWANVGATFPDLAGARSTTQYRNDEQWLLRTQLPPLEGLRILKTDLWDEAKNTHVLRWAATQGARAIGVDISPAITTESPPIATRAGARGRTPTEPPVPGPPVSTSSVSWRGASQQRCRPLGPVLGGPEVVRALHLLRVVEHGSKDALGMSQVIAHRSSILPSAQGALVTRGRAEGQFT